ncbi:RNA polymerase sigma factor [Shouchella clausii]
MRTLPKEKRITVLLYYFFNMSDVEIAQLFDIPRSTVRYSIGGQALLNG